MKGKKLALLLIPAALGVVLFTSLAVGVSFALFTSQSQTEVNISSGTINFVPSLREYTPVDNVTPLLKTYSAVADPDGELEDESHNHYRHEEQGFSLGQNGIVYDFSNHGFATYTATPGVINLNNITPGDMVKFQFDIVNTSNIAIKYHFTYKIIDPNELGDDAYVLAKGLKSTFIDGTTAQIDAGTAEAESFVGLKEYESNWKVLAPETNPNSVGFEISLPMDAGNTYQNKSASILITFETIQGNATTEDVGPTYIP